MVQRRAHVRDHPAVDFLLLLRAETLELLLQRLRLLALDLIAAGELAVGVLVQRILLVRKPGLQIDWSSEMIFRSSSALRSFMIVWRSALIPPARLRWMAARCKYPSPGSARSGATRQQPELLAARIMVMTDNRFMLARTMAQESADVDTGSSHASLRPCRQCSGLQIRWLRLSITVQRHSQPNGKPLICSPIRKIMPKVRLAGTVRGERDPNREIRARLLYSLFSRGWDIYNSNGDQRISLSNIERKIIESDAFVFTPGATLEDLFKAVSIFVGYQTLDRHLSGETDRAAELRPLVGRAFRAAHASAPAGHRRPAARGLPAAGRRPG